MVEKGLCEDHLETQPGLPKYQKLSLILDAADSVLPAGAV